MTATFAATPTVLHSTAPSIAISSSPIVTSSTSNTIINNSSNPTMSSSGTSSPPVLRSRARTATTSAGTFAGSSSSGTTSATMLRGHTSGELSSPPLFNRSRSTSGAIASTSSSSASSSSTSSMLSGPNNELSPGKHAGPPLSASSGASAGAASSSSRRARSSSIITMQEIKENYDDDLDRSALSNLNADWVNAKGAWAIHIVLIVIGKIMVDSIPSIEQDTSWTIVLQTYLIATYIMFHFVEGVPFESNGGVFDRLTMWEQIDEGAQYTPAKKWLTCVPILLFLVSTHYTRYDKHPALFSLNIVSLLLFALIPKLPQLHRQRITFNAGQSAVSERNSGANTPVEAAMARAQLSSVAE